MGMSGKQVLVAENNAVTSEIMRVNLAAVELDVTIADDGLEAWERFKSRHFDLLITDQRMPGLTGVELCRFLRCEPGFGEDFPIIFVTGRVAEVQRQLAELDLSVVQIVAKPFSPKQLVASAWSAIRHQPLPSTVA